MTENKVEVIYVMGAGRSGTTVLATFLGNCFDIRTVGEMHQFYTYLLDDTPTAHGLSLKKDEEWSEVSNQFSDRIDIQNHEILRKKLEHHKRIPRYILRLYPNKDDFNSYIRQQEKIFKFLSESESHYLLDSSKYIARGLLLRKSLNLKVKIIYMTRDPRGVIWSFKKKVQTTTKPFRTLIYYNLINLMGMLVYFTHSKSEIIKIRYEDVMDDPKGSFEKLQSFLEIDLSDVSLKAQRGESFDMPNIVGGNRLKSNSSIKLIKDNEWKERMKWWWKAIYYFMALPFNIINRYKIF